MVALPGYGLTDGLDYRFLGVFRPAMQRFASRTHAPPPPPQPGANDSMKEHNAFFMF
jgi:hypothetical protein